MTKFDLFHSLFEYFPDTGSLIWRRNKGRAIAGSEVGSTTLRGYREVKVNQVCYKVHRVIFMMVTGEWPEKEIDHINGHKSDNRWVNLRNCTHAENMHNQLQHVHNTSGRTGVSWHKRICKWQAFIIHDGKQNHLGYFSDLSEAIQTREAAEQALWCGFRQVDEIVSPAQ